MSESANDSQLKTLLEESKTIAVVGCSNSPGKPSNTVPTYLKRHGYRIVPVNPNHDSLIGEKAYPRLSDVLEKVDIVNVFRPSEEAADIVSSALRLLPKAVWLQLGIRSVEGAKLAEDAGILFIEDKCIRIEHQRLFER